MLDDLAIHIGDIKRAVGRVGQLHGTEPKIGGSEEFNLLFIRWTLRHQSNAIRPHLFSMHEVAPAISDKCIPEVLLRPTVAAEDSDTGSGSEIARRAAAAFDRPRHLPGDA